MTLWERVMRLFSPRAQRQAAEQRYAVQQLKRIQAYQAARINAMRREAAIYARERDHDGNHLS